MSGYARVFLTCLCESMNKIQKNSHIRENNNDLTNLPTAVMTKKSEFRGRKYLRQICGSDADAEKREIPRPLFPKL